MSMATTQSSPAEMPLAQIAASSSFATAMRILPPERREAMHAIYAFCRAVDDIADDLQRPRDVRGQELAAWRDAIDRLYELVPPRLAAPLLAPVARFGLRRNDFLAIIDGMQMDVDADICAPDEPTLDLYCDRVASAVGRLSVRVFGLSDGQGIPLAHHLGRALQLTNILRDLDEDAGMGRLYLPRELLLAAGIEPQTPQQVTADPRIAQVCDILAARAHEHFRTARAIMDSGSRDNVRCPRVMADVYEALLNRITARGWDAPRTRIRTPKLRALYAMLRYGLI
jgi:phytoene synthase